MGWEVFDHRPAPPSRDGAAGQGCCGACAGSLLPCREVRPAPCLSPGGCRHPSSDPTTVSGGPTPAPGSPCPRSLQWGSLRSPGRPRTRAPPGEMSTLARREPRAESLTLPMTDSSLEQSVCGLGAEKPLCLPLGRWARGHVRDLSPGFGSLPRGSPSVPGAPSVWGRGFVLTPGQETGSVSWARADRWLPSVGSARRTLAPVRPAGEECGRGLTTSAVEVWERVACAPEPFKLCHSFLASSK